MTKKDIYLRAIDAAKAELRQAERNLDNAEHEFVVAAVYEILAKMERLNVLIRLAKEECE